ncbi:MULTISPECIES: NfeD family protein [Staphylococcus]|uniref:NfeD family protein n=1 Tax=Staphylococcus TaxID=1279 RepID=UPI0001F48F01|nr:MULTISPECIES: NfeD family protein [Staphylococcus]ATQ59381.1 serine protease [Staphylococcus epidermidis]EFV89129.1 nfeD-like family protein [Staphylococcus epidermidis FRI909]MBF2231539.1 serine protease [Staphylococcus epidermidis]MBF2335858.1 serine protease [Staphylococcus epidermidis]MBG3870794.1 serine protease [Staphylococcus epidermidis]
MDNLHLIHMLFMTKPLNGMNWVENLAQFITQPFVSLIFTCIIFIGFLYQLYSKRINLMGIIALLALLLLFLAFLINGDVNVMSVLLFTIGLILLIIELFVIGAVIGMIGIILITLSIIILGDNILLMLGNVIVALILSIIEWVILVKIFNRKIPFLDKVILKDSTNSEAGYRSHDDRSHLLGKTAHTVTDLRPAGIITCDNDRIDAVSDGSFILRNRQVKILEVEGTRVVVREIEK